MKKEKMKKKYVIWDWNGTLIDDVDACVSALNRMLTKRMLPLTDKDFYRMNFGFPVRPFYSQLGMNPDAEWDCICTEFHDYAHEGPQHIRHDAFESLELVQKSGIAQSILSALRQDLLLRDTNAEGVQDFFELIFGVDNLDGASKLSRANDLMAKLFPNGADGFDVYFIGDTLHDAEVARAIGAKPVLVDGGHQHASRLASAGCPVADSLYSAVKMILSE